MSEIRYPRRLAGRRQQLGSSMEGSSGAATKPVLSHPMAAKPQLLAGSTVLSRTMWQWGQLTRLRPLGQVVVTVVAALAVAMPAATRVVGHLQFLFQEGEGAATMVMVAAGTKTHRALGGVVVGPRRRPITTVMTTMSPTRRRHAVQRKPTIPHGAEEPAARGGTVGRGGTRMVGTPQTVGGSQAGAAVLAGAEVLAAEVAAGVKAADHVAMAAAMARLVAMVLVPTLLGASRTTRARTTPVMQITRTVIATTLATEATTKVTGAVVRAVVKAVAMVGHPAPERTEQTSQPLTQALLLLSHGAVGTVAVAPMQQVAMPRVAALQLLRR